MSAKTGAIASDANDDDLDFFSDDDDDFSLDDDDEAPAIAASAPQESVQIAETFDVEDSEPSIAIEKS